MSAGPEVKLSKRGLERWKKGHPWIYESDVEAPKSLRGGEVVRVTDARGWLLGQAFFARTSKISLRWLAWDDRAIDRAFFLDRVRAADALRAAALPGVTAYRAVHAEADGLPGVVVDRFGDCLSVQLLVKASDDRRELFFDVLEEHFHPKAIVERSDVSVRRLEGLEPKKGVARGALAGPVEWQEGDVTMRADLLEGQKTGAFLDQRDNHLTAGRWARGKALDCFAYTGGFALQLARRAEHVTAVEISEGACGLVRESAARNGVRNLEVVCANAFDYLRDAVDEGKKFDTIVLDPPSFAKNKGAIEAALRGYKEINLRALQLLNPGGVLVSASCTYHVDESAFEDMLDAAAADAKRRVQIVERRGAGPDHPVLLSLRETRYLKCYVLRAL